MRNKKITTVQGLTAYIKNNSSWPAATIRNVITALGYNPNGGRGSLVELSGTLADCAMNGAGGGFPGFIYYSETVQFYRRNQQDIVKNLEITAEELGEDIIGMVRHFGVFRHDRPPSAGGIVRALWGTGKLQDDLTGLYNAFAWFCLEEVSHIWYRYLEDNPAYYAELSA
jgi:hypothetical protein